MTLYVFARPASRRRTTHRVVLWAALTCTAMCAGPVLGASSVVSGKFTGDEATATPVNQPDCTAAGDLAYQLIGPLVVDVAGEYQVRDAGRTTFSQDSVLNWYEGMPNPGSPQAGLVATVDDVGAVALEAGTDYYLLVQPWCALDADLNGVWGQHVSGPGLLTGAQTVATPAWWSGAWSGNEPLAAAHPDPACPATYADVSAPQQFDETGIYFLSATSGYDDQYLWVSVYEGGFNPNNPLANQVASVNGGGVFLEQGTTYRFVVQPDCGVYTGPWYFVLWPPAPFALNSSMSGTYYNPETAGQGVLLDVDGDTGFVFGAWFTWANIPEGQVNAPLAVGDPNQRWLVMDGKYEPGDAGVDLQLYTASGGTFFGPATDTGIPTGTARLQMEDCQNGSLTFDLDSGESGSTAMIRLLQGNTRHCYDLISAPGVLYE